MKLDPQLSVLYGELVLSLYPILVKTVSTPLFTQILARFLVFPALALAFGPFSDFTKIWGSPYESFVGILHGFFNVGHVLMSYLSYKLLPAGSAVSLFYLYPIFNIIIGSIALGESYPPQILLLIPMALFGTYLITTAEPDKDNFNNSYKINKEAQRGKEEQEEQEEQKGKQLEKEEQEEKEEKEKQKQQKNKRIGIAAAILAAITESVIFLFIRSNTDAFKSPFYTIDHLYPAGLAALLMYGITNPSSKKIIDTSPKNWIKLLGFNAVLGFTGYLARFYGLPKVSTLLFSLLSFVGVISAYVWGSLFANEKITKRGLTGSLLIASSIGLIRYFGLA